MAHYQDVMAHSGDVVVHFEEGIFLDLMAYS